MTIDMRFEEPILRLYPRSERDGSECPTVSCPDESPHEGHTWWYRSGIDGQSDAWIDIACNCPGIPS